MMSDLDHLPQRDVERLSAYLDSALSNRETARLEARLAEDPSLQSALEELREAVWLLRSMPEIKTPRNFTLTPEMVGVHKRTRVYPILQFATALTTLAFLFVVGLDAVTFFGAGRSMDRVAFKNVEIDTAPAEVEAPMIAQAPAEVAAEAESAAVAEQPAAADELIPAPAEDGEGAFDRDAATPFMEYAEEPQAPEAEGNMAEGLPPTATGTRAMTVEESTAGEEVEKAVGAVLDASVTSSPPPEDIPAAPSTTVDDMSEERVETTPPFLSPFRLVELVLGAVATLLAVLTIRIRKKAS